ncbi:MAG: ComEA family DNA-binding protein [Streptosporangiales bacterium]|nr:ComEA family DNA-binding protein [Streptosporangiales bacterium]
MSPVASPEDTLQGERAPAPTAVRGMPAMPAFGQVAEGLRGALALGRPGAWALVVVGLIAAIVTGWYVMRGRPVAEPVAVQPQARPAPVAAGGLPPRAPPGGPSPAPSLVVQVGGKVREPGVLTLPAGSRVIDALRAAGGPRPGVETGRLNLARRLIDGEQILVGVPGAEPPAGPGDPGASAAPGTGIPGGPAGGAPGGAAPLNLNAATAAQLEQLPGIGPVLAQRIVEHRTRIGGFRSVDQLRDVSGIGEKKYAELAPGVHV